MSKRSVFFVMACLLLAGSSVARTEELAAQISLHDVAAVLATNSIHVSPEQISLPFAVPVRSANRQLEIASFDAVDATHAKVKFRCRNAGDCLPFLATVNWRSKAELQSAGEQWSKSKPVTTLERPAAPAPLLVRSGDTATLVLEGKHVRIQLAVICLASGSAGKTIRVTTTDRQRIYRAEVVAAGQLRWGL